MERYSSAKLGEKNIKSKKVYRYTLDGMYIDEFGSTHEAARKLGRKDGSNIAKCARSVKQTAYKFKWSYDAPV